MICRKVCTFAAVNKNNRNMKIEMLTKDEMSQVYGGGYWVILGNGTKNYIPDGDEVGDEDEMIFL